MEIESYLFLQLFDPLIEPVLTCAAEVWGLENIGQI